MYKNWYCCEDKNYIMVDLATGYYNEHLTIVGKSIRNDWFQIVYLNGVIWVRGIWVALFIRLNLADLGRKDFRQW